MATTQITIPIQSVMAFRSLVNFCLNKKSPRKTRPPKETTWSGGSQLQAVKGRWWSEKSPNGYPPEGYITARLPLKSYPWKVTETQKEAGSSSFHTIFQGRTVKLRGGNRWFGARWFGILGVQPSNNPFSFSGIPGIQTTGPQTNN